MEVLKTIHKRIVKGVFVLFAIGLIAGIANAFEVNPGRVEITMPAGERYIGSFIVTNPGAAPVTIGVSAEDWSASQYGREIAKGDRSFLDWLRFMPQELELGPNQSGTVQYVVNIPKEARGEYIAMIYFGDAPDTSGGQISLRSRIGNALYVTIRGTEVVEGKITDISVSQEGPLKIKTSVENMGNVHIRPKGSIKIIQRGLLLNGKKRNAMKILFNEAGFPVLPLQTYLFEASLKKKMEPGRYSLELNMEFGKGRFKQGLDFSIDENGKVAVKGP